MTKRILVPAILVLAALVLVPSNAFPQWDAPVAGVIPEAQGYVFIPNAAVRPDKARTYRAIFDTTRTARDASEVLPGLNMAGAELNAFAANNIPLRNAKFVVIVHGAAVDGLLDEAHYRAKYKAPNPNLKLIADLKKAGVELYVCGQTLARERIAPNTIAPDVRIASAAAIVLMTYQNDGYALLTY